MTTEIEHENLNNSSSFCEIEDKRCSALNPERTVASSVCLSQSSIASYASSFASSNPSSYLSGSRGRLQYPGPPIKSKYAMDNLMDDLRQQLDDRPRAPSARPEVTPEATVSDDGFLVKSDLLCSCGCKVMGLLVLAAVVACIVVASRLGALVSNDKANEGTGAQTNFFELCIGSSLLTLFAQVLLFQIGAPTALYLSRVHGEWSLTLQRRAMAPVVRRVTDLEAFLETFGYEKCFRLRFPFRTRKVGYTTSKSGTVRLFFAQSAAGGAPLVLSCSLQEPLAFFTKLRDITSTTPHRLSVTVAEYVEDWEGESFGSNPQEQDTEAPPGS